MDTFVFFWLHMHERSSVSCCTDIVIKFCFRIFEFQSNMATIEPCMRSCGKSVFQHKVCTSFFVQVSLLGCAVYIIVGLYPTIYYDYKAVIQLSGSGTLQSKKMIKACATCLPLSEKSLSTVFFCCASISVENYLKMCLGIVMLSSYQGRILED